MKPEPLDLDLEELWSWFEKKFGKDAMNRYYGYETDELIKEIKQRVKSAVKGFCGDIKKYLDEYERAIDLAEEKGLDELKLRLEKEVAGLRFALRRIDKWFKDVIE